MSDLTKLCRIRAGHRSYVTKVINDCRNPCDFKTKRTLLESRQKILVTLNDEILQLISDDKISIEIEESSDLDEQIFSCLNFIDDQLNQVPSISTVSSTIKLPKLDLKKFAGDFCSWRPFWECFEAAVDNNSSLTSVEKMNYLVSYLEGNALKSVQGLSLSAANYKIAIDTLTSRFGNNQAVINAHVDNLFKVRSVENCDVVKLRNFYDYVHIQVRSLASSGVQQTTYENMLLPMLLNRLPDEIRLKLARKSAGNVWCLKDLFSILLSEIQARETCAVGRNQNTNFSNNRVESAVAKSVSSSHRYGTSNTFVTNTQSVNCVYCSRNHLSENCRSISDFKARREYLKSNRLCFICTNPGHLASTCSKQCSKCQRRHHVSICYDANKPPPATSAYYVNTSSDSQKESGHAHCQRIM
jgi:hypothetical protein